MRQQKSLMYTFIFICQRKGMHTLSNMTCYLVSWNLQDCSRYQRLSVKSQMRNTLRMRMFQAHVSMILSKSLERKKKKNYSQIFKMLRLEIWKVLADRGMNESSCVQYSARNRHSSLSLDIYGRSIPQLYVPLSHWTLCLSMHIIQEHTAQCWGAKLKPDPAFLAQPSMLINNIPAITMAGRVGLDRRPGFGSKICLSGKETQPSWIPININFLKWK